LKPKRRQVKKEKRVNRQTQIIRERFDRQITCKYASSQKAARSKIYPRLITRYIKLLIQLEARQLIQNEVNKLDGLFLVYGRFKYFKFFFF